MSTEDSANPKPTKGANKYKFEQTYSFKHTLERVWYIIRDFSILSIIKPDSHFPLIVKDGKTSWTINAEFCGKSNNEEYIGKCVKVINLPQHKQIVWDIKTISGKEIQMQYQLFQVSEGDGAVLLYKLKFNNEEDYNEFQTSKKQNLEEEFNDLMEKINNTLKDSSLNLFQFEGGVVRGPMEETWEYLININKLKKIAPLIHFDQEEDDNNDVEPKPGNIRKILYENKKHYYLAKILIYDKKNNWNKWMFGFEAFYGEPKIPFQKVLITLTKITVNECHIAFFHEFKETISKEQLHKLALEKKYVIKSIKDFIEKKNILF